MTVSNRQNVLLSGGGKTDRRDDQEQENDKKYNLHHEGTQASGTIRGSEGG